LQRELGHPLDAPLSRLFPDLFGILRPVTTPEVPVIVAASILSIYDSPMLPIIKDGTTPGGGEEQGGRLFQAVSGLSIIRMVMETKPSEYYKALWRPCTTTTVWIGSLSFDDTLENLLRIFEATGFGDARVEAATPPNALVTLTEVISLYRQMKLSCKLEVKKVASPAIFVDPDMKLIDAMRLMYDRKVRRLFLTGREDEFVSDRNILALLLSPKGLKVARDNPEFWTELSLSAAQSVKARAVSSHALVEDAGRLSEIGHDVFILSDKASVLSRWDLVMKPWKDGRLLLSL
jgi:CBS domain-containing protein